MPEGMHQYTSDVEDKEYDIIDSSGDFVEKAGVPVVPIMPKLTKSQIGKIYKAQVTIQHPIAAQCGHRLDLTKQPRNRNCANCWFNWLNHNGAVVQTAEELIAGGNSRMVVQLQGQKFLDNVLKFLSTIANLQKQEGAEK
jgi:hypothetical protein